MTSQGSPIILNLSWGEIEVRVSGESHRFKDCQIWPDGAEEWDWNRTGTSHSNGIQTADVELLVEQGAEIIVLSTGQHNRLQVAPETRDYLKAKGIPVYIKETNKAVEHFNQLSREGKAVGGLFHSTC